MSEASVLLEDLDRLAHETHSDARREMLHKLTDLFIATSDMQNESHRSAFGEILENMAYHLETAVRAELAERLADQDTSPMNLLERLALDEIPVASPVLTRSKILSDDFLKRVAQSQSQGHLLAISKRREISTNVTDVLLNRGNEHVMEKVVKNDGAKISRSGFETVSKRGENNENINRALYERSDTPKDIIDIVKTRVLHKLKSEPPMGATNDEIERAVEVQSATLEIKQSEELNDLREISRLHEAGELNETTMLQFLRSFKLKPTIVALSHICDVNEATIKYCLLDADLSAVAVLSRANQFDRSTFANLLKLREQERGEDAVGIADTLRNYDKLDLKMAQRVMRFLKLRQSTPSLPPENEEG